MFIDTHCHLDFKVFDKSYETLLKKCDDAGIKHFINPATQRSTWDSLIELNKRFNNIHICFGLHPSFIKKHSYSDLQTLEKYIQKTQTKLVGEIGLDKRFNDFDKQLKIFSSQVDIAKNFNKRIIVHSVKSHNEIIKIFKDSNFQNGGIIHAFNGNYDIAKNYVDLGFKIGVGGIISHPNSKLKETLNKINSRDIVLETDSPDMPLYNSDNKINTPTNIPKIFDLLCNIYESNPDILKQQIYNTSLEFL